MIALILDLCKVGAIAYATVSVGLGVSVVLQDQDALDRFWDWMEPQGVAGPRRD